MNNYQLAQINIAKARAPMDSATMEGFVSRLDEINLLAEKSNGLVWRLKMIAGELTGIKEYDQSNTIVNMSVWKDIESLKNYVYKSVHVELIHNRAAWFNKMTESQMVLWWIPEGQIPSIQEGKEKLQYLDKNGPTDEAFTFAKSFPSPYINQTT